MVKYKVVSFYAKKARGLMCRFIIQNRLERVEQLKEFDLGGYWFDATSSTEKNLYLSEISMNKFPGYIDHTFTFRLCGKSESASNTWKNWV